MKPKVIIVGLDCAAPDIVFHKMRGKLPTLESLISKGVHGPLTSTIPPITVPAWASMITSKDPGQLGLYGFRNRADFSYDKLFLANSGHLKETTLFQILSRKRLHSIMLGVPLTYPPRPLLGVMVSGFLAPNKNSRFTYPEEFKQEIDDYAGGDYVIDVEDFRTDNKHDLLNRILKMSRARFKLARNLIKYKEWDMFMMVEMGLDRLHHGFWRFHDSDHRLYEPGNEFENVICDYYIELDKEIGRIIEEAPCGTLIMVVSDHGARNMEGGFSLNQWLIQEGYLTLKEMPENPVPLGPEMVDWSKTYAWGEGGYYGRLFLNIKGREPEGRIPMDEQTDFLKKITEDLENTLDHQGKVLGTKVFRPEEIYRENRNIPPDLLVYFGDLAWRSVGSVGETQPIHVFANDTGPDDANHAQEGIFIMGKKGADSSQGARIKPRNDLTIYDVAPTVLSHLGLEIPKDMIGKIIE